jgi:hypothetical protein
MRKGPTTCGAEISLCEFKRRWYILTSPSSHIETRRVRYKELSEWNSFRIWGATGAHITVANILI